MSDWDKPDSYEPVECTECWVTGVPMWDGGDGPPGYQGPYCYRCMKWRRRPGLCWHEDIREAYDGTLLRESPDE